MKTIGTVLLVLGILLLIMGIVFSFTVGTIATPIILLSSIFINTLGITMLRWKR